MVKPHVECSQVSFSYRHHMPILTDISFTLSPGERILIRGANGAGKSTLVKLLTHEIAPITGSITLFGSPLKTGKEIFDAKLATGYLPQIQIESGIAISVAESVLLGLYGKRFSFLRRSSREDMAEAEKALAAVGMSHMVHRDVRELSGGEKQKVAIARALVRSPRLLILDEPTTYLDEKSKKEITSLLHSLSAALTCSMIIISHEKISMEGISRTLMLEQGTLTEVSHAS